MKNIRQDIITENEKTAGISQGASLASRVFQWSAFVGAVVSMLVLLATLTGMAHFSVPHQSQSSASMNYAGNVDISAIFR